VSRWSEKPEVRVRLPKAPLKRKVMNRVFKRVNGHMVDTVKHTISTLE